MNNKQYTVTFIAHASEEPESDVPCGECNTCCKLSPFLTPEEFESGQYIYTFLKTDISDGPVVAIPRTENGCIYLVSGKCSIYTSRPLACRQFDCRKGHFPPLKQLALDKFGEYIEPEHRQRIQAD